METQSPFNPLYLLNILFLGLGASALCFVTWNLAVTLLGAIKTSVYIYMVPVITVVMSILILQEQITILTAVGTTLILAWTFYFRKQKVQKAKVKL